MADELAQAPATACGERSIAYAHPELQATNTNSHFLTIRLKPNASVVFSTIAVQQAYYNWEYGKLRCLSRTLSVLAAEFVKDLLIPCLQCGP